MPRKHKHSCDVELALVVQYLNKTAQRREVSAKSKGLPASERAVAMIHADCLRTTAACLVNQMHRNTPFSGTESNARTPRETDGTTPSSAKKRLARTPEASKRTSRA